MCDMANVSRNVVGVGTSDTGHTLTLRGSETGETSFYVIYIDHNIHPDYQILERYADPREQALPSFDLVWLTMRAEPVQ